MNYQKMGVNEFCLFFRDIRTQSHANDVSYIRTTLVIILKRTWRFTPLTGKQTNENRRRAIVTARARDTLCPRLGFFNWQMEFTANVQLNPIYSYYSRRPIFCSFPRDGLCITFCFTAQYQKVRERERPFTMWCL